MRHRGEGRLRVSERPRDGITLRGWIGSYTVADLFQFLARIRSTGQVVLDTGFDLAWVYFHKGALIYARRQGSMERLGEMLLRLGHVTDSQLAGANLRSGLSADKKRIGEILVEAGSLDRDLLQQTVKDQIREAVIRILVFKEAEFRFHEGRLPHGEDILLDVDLELLLLEGLRKIDELAGNPEGAGES